MIKAGAMHTWMIPAMSIAVGDMMRSLGLPARAQRYSTSLPAVETSRMSAAISAGMGEISSRVTPVAGDQTRFTCSDSASSG
jgi:hypothetical protein